MGKLDPHQRGLLLTFIGVMVLTPDTLLVRLIDSDTWTVTATRGLLSGPTILVAFLLFRRSKAIAEIRSLGIAGLLIAFLYCINSIGFVLAVQNTSVANTLVLLAAIPLMAALMSFIFLRERIATATWLAIFAGMAGVIIVVSNSLGQGTLFGDLCALGTAMSLAGTFVLIRRSRDVNMVPATGLGAIMSGLIALPLADIGGLSGTQIPYTLIMGLAVLPISFALITLGPRTLPAPEVALIMLLETIFGPIWVWLGVGEEPPMTTIYGGGIIIATLVVHSYWRLRRRPAELPAE